VAELILGELIGLRARINTRFLQDLLRGVLADADNISQRNPNGLVIGDINTNYTWHVNSLSYPIAYHPTLRKLPLALLMPRIRTNDPHNALAADNPAILTYTFDGTSDFHWLYLPAIGLSCTDEHRSTPLMESVANDEAQSGLDSNHTVTSQQ
jgi:hypothetical protein